ncbi:MAG TPA: ABC-type transport auxiliary lipoprotein family protein [Allosphingosinicella sp.]|nr:ABC-type transport auxiliary lipoprotein family protein [Allosphingosinicella sp.]
MRKTILTLGAALTLAGCFGGAKVPDTLMTLNPAQSRAAATTRSAAEGQAITVVVPTVPRELQTLRVPVHETELGISYLKNAQWVEMPSELFARLVSETIAATTGRVVLDPKQFTFDPGQRLTGTLQRFGLDATRMEVVAVYDAVLARQGGGITSRRFEARVPVAAVDGPTVAPALNQAANQIATEVAGWVGA